MAGNYEGGVEPHCPTQACRSILVWLGPDRSPRESRVLRTRNRDPPATLIEGGAHTTFSANICNREILTSRRLLRHNTAIMSHESVWNSRPRNYGKGSRSWYDYTIPKPNIQSRHVD